MTDWWTDGPTDQIVLVKNHGKIFNLTAKKVAKNPKLLKVQSCYLLVNISAKFRNTLELNGTKDMVHLTRCRTICGNLSENSTIA